MDSTHSISVPGYTGAWCRHGCSVANPDPVGYEPFWSDPINCPDLDPAIKSHNKENLIS